MMNLSEVATSFDVPGQLVTVQSLGSGNVNDTYRAIFRTTFDETQFVLQRINTHVFPHPEEVMTNIQLVTEHAHQRIREESQVADRIWQLPRVILTRNGNLYHQTEEGDVWRALTLISSAHSHDRVDQPEIALEAGQVLGHFQRIISDFPIEKLADTLPGFHVTPTYLAQCDHVLESAKGRERLQASSEARRMGQFVEERRSLASCLEDAALRGDLLQRPIHGDPKITNIMIDDYSGKGTAIVDLDTVKPGLIHYDFGDAVRSTCNRAGEETENLEEVVLDLDLLTAFVKGYFREAQGFLTDKDREFLFDSVRLITFELGLRFYTDYLAGNRYFKVQHDLQNLNRARVQMRLCESIEAREPAIRRILDHAP
ncbi:MAG: aminoglycoside phosphotransferase family protein [Verrucomicrobiota bacterium]